MAYPRTPYDQEGGLYYFPRMVDKIRLNLNGELPEDYHRPLGKGFDGTMCEFLRVNYDDVVQQVKDDKTDAEVLTWCLENGRGLSELDIKMANAFFSKRGLKDDIAERLAERKKENGIADRDDIATMFDFMEYDEDRA
jgi:gluconokinase